MQLRTDRDEKLPRYHDVPSVVRCLALGGTSGEGRQEELLSKLQLLYEYSPKVPVLVGPSTQAVEHDPRVRELNS